ncbi:START domain-containing protein [Polyangium sp. 15x6]|uniref:START domain-containing protein n=1 Tax=Polyangium sp. 15x6 TaxID=3042687 RepID=UPI002499FE5C|nr:START domain-containing protein [Polyangium sp. 15x6]MDI3282531.1 START domain-containing protein [Polyangium sp. 15x6]
MRRWTFFAFLVSLVPLAASAEPPPPSPAQAGAPSQGRAPAPASSLASEGFTLLGEEKGVRVHRREKRAGIEFATEANLPAPPDQVRRALLDYSNHQKWQEHLKENKVLARSADSLLVYQRLDLPVIDDRDYTIQVTWGAEGSILWMRFATANERGPKPVADVVRVTAHEGGWRLEPDGKGTRAVYRFHLDVAGSVPSWLGKGQAKDDIIDFVVRLKKELPNYR